MEKPGIELTTPGLQGEWLNHYTMEASAEVVESPVGYGLSMTDSGLTPKLMTQSTAPKELTELTICQCQQLNLPLVHANM